MEWIPISRDNAPTMGHVPSELKNGGTILRRQTTYWDLRAADGTRWRLHFKDKAETRFVEAPFLTLGIFDSHPILDQYDQPWAELYFSGPSIDPAALLKMLDEQVAVASRGWRRTAEYLNTSADLRKGFGLVMRAPVMLVNIAASVFKEMRIATSVLPGSNPEAGVCAAIMDRNAIVARSFRFEPRDAA